MTRCCGCFIKSEKAEMLLSSRTAAAVRDDSSEVSLEKKK